MGCRKKNFSFKAFQLSNLVESDGVVRGGKMILPEVFFAELNASRKGFTTTTHTCLSVRSGTNETVLGVVEFSGPHPKHVFIPDWAMEQLQIENGDEVKIRPSTLPCATSVKVRLGPEARGVRDVEEGLQAHLKGFAAVCQGDKMKMKHEGMEFVLEVLDAEPEKKVRLPCIGAELPVEVNFEVPEEPAAMTVQGAEAGKREASDAEEPPVPRKRTKKEEPCTPSEEEKADMRRARIKKFHK